MHFFLILALIPLSYLNSIGEIIYLNRGQGVDERIIIDPHWFCGTVIGKLAEPNKWLPKELQVGPSAIVSRKFLLAKLRLDKISAEGAELALIALEQLLLIDKVVDQPDHYVVPVLLEGNNGAGLADWGESKDFSVVVGRRFECKNEPGFFPKLQVALSRTPDCENVRMGQGTICLVTNSCAVYVGLAKDMRCKLMYFWRIECLVGVLFFLICKVVVGIVLMAFTQFIVCMRAWQR